METDFEVGGNILKSKTIRDGGREESEQEGNEGNLGRKSFMQQPFPFFNFIPLGLTRK